MGYRSYFLRRNKRLSPEYNFINDVIRIIS